VLKGSMRSLKADINNDISSTKDNMTKYHLMDVVDRINEILNPKK
jgi:hypothetical protein